MLKKIIDLLLGFVFVNKCLLCEKLSNDFVCLDCFKKIKFKEQSCIKCGQKNITGEFCEKCKKYFSFNGIMVAGDFKDKNLAKLIKKFKYSFIKDLGYKLGLFLFYFFRENFIKNPIMLNNNNKFTPENSLLIPVPLSKKRLNWRGYNQSQILAEVFSKHSKIPLFEGVKRIKHKKAQAKLSLSERKNNLKNCFSVLNEKKALLQIENKIIIIIDDVSTSGTTLQEVSLEVKKYKPKEIWGLVLAHG